MGAGEVFIEQLRWAIFADKSLDRAEYSLAIILYIHDGIPSQPDLGHPGELFARLLLPRFIQHPVDHT